MKDYSSIPKEIIYDQRIYLFDKLDGSQFRAQYSKAKGFYNFGTRSELIDRSKAIFGEAIDLFLNKYNENLCNIFYKNKYENVVCFCEFLGKNSFAGKHIPETHDVVLFDLNIYKVGILGPRKFCDLTQKLDTAKLLYSGYLTEELVELIRAGELEGITFEGVVGKADVLKQPEMFKIKTKAWLNKLKETCGSNSELYKQLE